MELTIISYYGKQTSRCGYCKGTECSVAHGMHAYNMTPIDYQDLIDRGWRRSGHYCYKPYNAATCCPCYTIRCDTTEFKLSKSHKKILKRMNRFLRDGKKEKADQAACSDNPHGSNGEHGGIKDEPQAPNVPIRDIDLYALNAPNSKMQAIEKVILAPDNVDKTVSSSNINLIPIEEPELVASKSSLADIKKVNDESKPPCKKAKQMRLERRKEKLAAKGIIEDTLKTSMSSNSSANQEKTIKDYISDTNPNDLHKLKVLLIPSNKGATVEVFKLYRKYQLIIHNDNPTRLTQANLERFCCKSPLKLKLVAVKSKHFNNSLNQSYGLYEKYQRHVHNDPPENQKEYLHFFQKSPLKHTRPHDSPSTGYGSFHQQYWLDDKLIAVGVIDILPYCVSSVYFFYDPDYSFLSLGTYGSLREIEFAQELAEKVPSLKNYYMGFYIHSCPKMRYKGKLVPSYLLCPETYSWKLLANEIRDLLDQKKYQRLNNDPEARDPNEFLENHLDLVLLLVENNTCVRYREYIQSFNIETLDNMLDIIRSRIYKEITGDDDDRESILEYGKLVGKTCAHRMVYVK